MKYGDVPVCYVMIITHDWSEDVDGLNMLNESWDKLVICRYPQHLKKFDPIMPTYSKIAQCHMSRKWVENVPGHSDPLTLLHTMKSATSWCLSSLSWLSS